MAILVRARSAILVPVLGGRIEEVLRSPSPVECFKDKTADPQRAVFLGVATVAYAADENALKELSKLMELNDQRFGLNDWRLGVQVDQVLADGASRNFFRVAYKGLEIGSPWLDGKMITWIQRCDHLFARAADACISMRR